MSLDSSTSQQSAVQARLTTFGGRVALAIIALGLVLIGLGYNGVAGASINGIVDLRAQLPYLVSGAILGLAVVIVGAALMISQSARADRVRLEAKLDLLIDLQSDATGGLRTAPSDVEGLFAAGVSSYHVPSCRLVEGREQTPYVTAEEAHAANLKPCRVCQPAGSNVSLR